MIRQQLGALTLLAAFALPLAAAAQTAPAAGPPAMAHPFHRGGYMHALRQLNLTAEQKQQIVAIRRANARALRRQIEAVLTPDQRAQLQASMPARRDATAVHAPSQ